MEWLSIDSIQPHAGLRWLILGNTRINAPRGCLESSRNICHRVLIWPFTVSGHVLGDRHPRGLEYNARLQGKACNSWRYIQNSGRRSSTGEHHVASNPGSLGRAGRRELCARAPRGRFATIFRYMRLEGELLVVSILCRIVPLSLMHFNGFCTPRTRTGHNRTSPRYDNTITREESGKIGENIREHPGKSGMNEEK